jgi:LmbE family N-acetylglucosaminyl deacetylase
MNRSPFFPPLVSSVAKKVLVFSPHADDAELGVGGYLAKVIDAGGEALVALATVGPPQDLSAKSDVLAALRTEEFLRAMQVLGVQNSPILSEGFDGVLQQRFPQSRMVGLLEELIDDFEPDELLLPLPSAHQDHSYCWQVGIAASRPRAGRFRPALIAGYEYPLTHWGAGAAFSSFQGGLYENVTKTWSRKLASLKAHMSQLDRSEGHPIGIDGVNALGRTRGMEAGCEYAELLIVVRMLRDE